MGKSNLIRKENINNREILVYHNSVKARIPISPPGFAHKSKKDHNRIKGKITVDNWDRLV